jgi:hypothetical protein
VALHDERGVTMIRVGRHDDVCVEYRSPPRTGQHAPR